MNNHVLRLVAGAALLLFGCATAQVSPDAVELSVDFAWQASDRCSSQSPVIRVKNIPAATKTLQIKLKDRDVPTWNHGGGTVAYDGSDVIPAGALQDGYNGPCPPSGSHRYQFTVKAIDAAGVIVGTGQQTRNFP
ncbi:MAG: phospholipid-binding protein [Desulfobacteraceae bacterium]|nr:phospholipid-binding protein [Desulfobacteraceae bacterium]MBC2753228.1 phospholipid-binding protein [Desulfobacteraceae bacterium]